MCFDPLYSEYSIGEFDQRCDCDMPHAGAVFVNVSMTTGCTCKHFQESVVQELC